MKESAALNIIQKKIDKKFISATAAAAHFKVTANGLNNALAGKQMRIPVYLLDFADLEFVPSYVEKN